MVCLFFASFTRQKITCHWKYISIFSLWSFFLLTSSVFLKWQLFIKQIEWVSKNKNPFLQIALPKKHTLLLDFPMDNTVAIINMILVENHSSLLNPCLPQLTLLKEAFQFL